MVLLLNNLQGSHMTIELELLTDTFTVHRLHPDDPIPSQLAGERFYFIGRTERELSIVCPERKVIDSQLSEPGWRAFRVRGQLDFGLTGVLAGISASLADAGVSIFALSTFETDIILIKQDKLDAAVKALSESGYTVQED